jgi:RNA polymerase sigma-70 factor (ECF subfamily)
VSNWIEGWEYTMPSDRDLLDQILRRDASAFEELMVRHRGAVLACVGRILRDQAEAQDIGQEVFLRVWSRAEQWSGDGSVEAWILRIARNLALNQFRSTGRRRWQPLPQAPAATEDDDEDSQPSWLTDVQGLMPDEAAQRLEKHQLVRDLLADLSEDKRELLRLVFDAEMELNDVAERLGIPLGTVKSRLHYTVKNLKREWDQFRQDLEETQ